MTKPMNSPAVFSKEEESAFMRAFYWKVAKIVLLVIIGIGLLWLLHAIHPARAALQSLGGGVGALVALKCAGAVAAFGITAVVLRLVFPGQRPGRMAHLYFCLIPAAIGFDGLLDRETDEAGLRWLGNTVMVLALVVLVVAVIRQKRALALERKEPKIL